MITLYIVVLLSFLMLIITFLGHFSSLLLLQLSAINLFASVDCVHIEVLIHNMCVYLS